MAVEAARELNRLPGRLVAYAGETADTSLGATLSPPVVAAAGLLTRWVEDEIVEIVRHHAAAAGGLTA